MEDHQRWCRLLVSPVPSYLYRSISLLCFSLASAASSHSKAESRPESCESELGVIFGSEPKFVGKLVHVLKNQVDSKFWFLRIFVSIPRSQTSLPTNVLN